MKKKIYLKDWFQFYSNNKSLNHKKLFDLIIGIQIKNIKWITKEFQFFGLNDTYHLIYRYNFLIQLQNLYKNIINNTKKKIYTEEYFRYLFEFFDSTTEFISNMSEPYLFLQFLMESIFFVQWNLKVKSIHMGIYINKHYNY